MFEEVVLKPISWYTPQSRRVFEEKQSFYDEWKGELDMHSVDDLVMCFIDISGHMGWAY